MDADIRLRLRIQRAQRPIGLDRSRTNNRNALELTGLHILPLILH
jgi:hypothetical protein